MTTKSDDAENERIEKACERLALSVAALNDTSRHSAIELMAIMRGGASRVATVLTASVPGPVGSDEDEPSQ